MEILIPVFLGFLLLYTFSYGVIFRRRSNLAVRAESASCVISLAHGTPVAVMAARSLLHHQERLPSSFAAANTPFQNEVLDFSLAYFSTDLLHYVLFHPDDVLFIAHHLATGFVLATCRYLVSHGACAVLGLLLLAEVTSFCQNVWTLARARRGESAFARKLCDLLSPPFYVYYSVVRGIIAPIFTYKMGAFYLSGKADGVIPRWLCWSWMIVVVTAIAVSILWISNLWAELYQKRVSRLKLEACVSDSRSELESVKKVR
ncbi:TLC domain-containing protein At5g14285-like [Nymphaea colorata]|uniref:TLC domain-containing protein n=1 Tax=Nymphaea colorata TaxID=210225 RepID=A0A5K1B4C6_9MAGN|nr:TLC domain-containing protein At5g14285-like [Nymphaea colorata]